MARKTASVQTGAWSSSLNSKETPKVSKRGVRGEGHPSKQTPEVVSKLARAISLGLNDEESASLAGISDLTLTFRRTNAISPEDFVVEHRLFKA
jgi:hypothetical protein